MPAYLLSVMHGDEIEWPEGVAMEDVFRDVDAFNTQIQEEGRWVFGGGLDDDRAGQHQGEGALTDGPLPRGLRQRQQVHALAAADQHARDVLQHRHADDARRCQQRYAERRTSG